jgi:coatomer subunit beta
LQSYISYPCLPTLFQERPPLRKYLMDGDFFMGASLATTITKLALRYNLALKNSKSEDAARKMNRFTAESMLVLTSILHLGKSGLPAKSITPDDADRISFCLKVLVDQTPAINTIFQVYND